MAVEPQSLRERQKLETRTAIADAAGVLFARDGFGSVTVGDVARAAGVSRQTVFNHFPNKEDLVFDRAPEVEAMMVAALRDRAPGSSYVDAFRLLTRAFWERIIALPADRPQGGFFAIVDGSPHLQAYARELGARIVARLAEAIREDAGAAPDDPRPKLVAAALATAHQSVLDVAGPRIAAGEHPRAFVPALLDAADAAYDLLEGGIGGYP